MPGFKKVSFHFIFSLSLILLLSHCKHNDHKQLDAETVRKYEIQLDSLRQKTNQLSPDADLGKIISFYHQSKQILNLLPDTSKMKSKIQRFFLFKLHKVGGYVEAIKLARQIISRSNNFEDSVNPHLQVYGVMVSIYKNTGKADSALIMLRIAVARAKLHHKEIMITSPLNNIGMYFYELGNYDSAMVYFSLADSLLENYSSKLNYWKKFHGTVKDNMAAIYEYRSDFEKAKTIYEENFYMFQKFNAHFRWMDAGISLANAKIQLHKYDDAKKLIDHISSLMDTTNYNKKLTTTLYLFEVDTKYHKSVNDTKNTLVDLFEVYTKYYISVNDTKNALVYLEKRSKLVNNLNKIQKLKLNKTAIKLAHSASERSEQKLQIEKSEREKEEKRSLFLLWVIIMGVLGSIIIFYFLRQRIKLHEEKAKLYESNRLLAEEKLKTQDHEQSLLNLELEYKKKDLVDMALSLLQKQEWAQKLDDHIQNIESAKGKKRSREFKKLKDEIRNQIYVDKKLEILQQNIDMLSKEFFDKLSNQFPGLTKTDKKLCCYIKLNLTTTEIAGLQNIDPLSVNVSRYRLKKKLNLGTEQNLDTFLQTF